MAKHKSQFWRYLIIFILGHVSRITAGLLFISGAVLFYDIDPENFNKVKNDNNVLRYLWTFIQVITAIIVFSFAYGKLHSTGFKALTYHSGIHVKNVIYFGTVFIVVKFAVETVITYSTGGDFRVSGELSPVVPTLILGISTLIIASTFEEIVFRGYFLRSLFEYSSRQILSSIAISIMFSINHWSKVNNYSNPFIGFLELFTWSMFISLFTLKSRSLEIAIGIHIFSNLSQHFILGNLPRALLIRPYVGGLYEVLVLILSFAICYFIFRRYNRL